MGSGMNRKEAEELASKRTYRWAVNNIVTGKGIKFRKATMIKLRELAEIADRLDRKTEPQTCDTCKWGEWYRKGYDITMMSDECGGCCSWNNKWTPKDEPQIFICPIQDDYEALIEDEPQTEKPKIRKCADKPFRAVWLDDDYNEMGKIK